MACQGNMPFGHRFRSRNVMTTTGPSSTILNIVFFLFLFSFPHMDEGYVGHPLSALLNIHDRQKKKISRFQIGEETRVES